MITSQIDGYRYIWKCDQCSATFISSYYMDRHKEIPHDGKRHKCRFCKDVFILPHDLHRHKLLRHESEIKVRNRDDNARTKGDISSRIKMTYQTRRDNIKEKVNELRKLTGLTDKQMVVEVLNYVIYVLNGKGLTGLASPLLPQESIKYQKHIPLELEGHNALKKYVIKNRLSTDYALTHCKVLDIIITFFKNIKAKVPASFIAPPLVSPLPAFQNHLPPSIAPQPVFRPVAVNAPPLVSQHPFSIESLLRPTRPN